MKDNTYLQKFLQLKCAGDILNVVSPINRCEKEISESWAILRKIKPLILANPWQYLILDLCAGNALTSVMSAFILPVSLSSAVDIKRRERDWQNVRNFEYWEKDIYNNDLIGEWTGKIIVSSHPCKHALRIIEIFNKSSAKALCIIPCCHSEINLPAKQFLQTKIGKYDAWTYYLASLITKYAKITINTDRKIQSPKNNVIYAERP